MRLFIIAFILGTIWLVNSGNPNSSSGYKKPNHNCYWSTALREEIC